MAQTALLKVKRKEKKGVGENKKKKRQKPKRARSDARSGRFGKTLAAAKGKTVLFTLFFYWPAHWFPFFSSLRRVASFLLLLFFCVVLGWPGFFDFFNTASPKQAFFKRVFPC